MKRSKQAFNFQLEPRDLLCLFLVYCCPRPVSLVTVSDGDRLNMFPMDLIGEVDCGLFSMALRSTSPSVQTILDSGRLTLAGAPDALRDHVYELGKHHRVRAIDLDALPFPTESSPVFGHPIASGATRVREIELTDHRLVGSHHLFLTRVVHDESRTGERQMFHVSGFGYHALTRWSPVRVDSHPARGEAGMAEEDPR